MTSLLYLAKKTHLPTSRLCSFGDFPKVPFSTNPKPTQSAFPHPETVHLASSYMPTGPLFFLQMVDFSVYMYAPQECLLSQLNMFSSLLSWMALRSMG